MNSVDKKPFRIAVLVTVLLLALTITLWFLVNNSNPEDYETVKVEVLSGHTTNSFSGKSVETEHEVVVSYEGKQYELKNLHSTWQYSVGEVTDAYLSNGVMYANIEGVKSNTALSTVYFVSLALTFIGICVTYALFWIGRKKKRELEGSY